MKELTTIEKKEILPYANGFLEHARQDYNKIGECFFMLGMRFYEAQIYNYVEALGYESIEQLAEKEFDLGRSTTYNLINIFKRFCDRDQYGNYKCWINPKYKNYSYSKLVEMEKMAHLNYNVEQQIPPQTPIRIIKEYVKSHSKELGTVEDLPDWYAKQQQAALPEQSKPNTTPQLPGQISIEDTPSTAVDITESIQIVAEPATTEPVQTFGLPTRADNEKPKTKHEPKEENSVICSIQTFSQEELEKVIEKTLKVFEQRVHTYTRDGLWLKTPPSILADELYYMMAKDIWGTKYVSTPKQEPKDLYNFNPDKYSLQNRQGVRDFLADYKNWHEAIQFKNFYFHNIYSCFLKNRTYIYACERKIYKGATLQLGNAETEVTYYFNAFRGDGVSEITKNQFEQYCAEHKDEL